MPTPAALARELADLVGPEHVLTDLADRVAYNNDCWPRNIILTRGQVIAAHMPAAIVRPADELEVQRVIQWARRTQTPIVPYGAGSGVCGGAVTDGQGVILDLKRLRALRRVEHDDLLIRAQSGLIGMNLELELQRLGLTLGHFPSSLLCSSLGGYLAARSAGQCSSRYGKIEDMVASMRVVTGAGALLETTLDPLGASAQTLDAGPDLTQLFVGSEGTLGVITEATLYVQPHPTTLAYRGFQFDGLDEALDAIQVMMQQGLRPAVVRLYDAFDTIIARRGGASAQTARDGLGRLKGALPEGMVERVAQWLTLSQPEAKLAEVSDRVEQITRGLMGRVMGQPLWLNRAIDALPDQCLLIVGFEGDGLATALEAEHAFELLRHRGLDLGQEPGEHWRRHRYSVSYKQSAIYAAGAFVDTMEVSTTWENLRRLYWAVRQALAPHVLVMAHFSHVYPEGSSIYFTFAGWASDGLEQTLERYDRAWRAGLDAVAACGASIAHHHGVGQSKAAWTARDHAGGPPLFEALKATFDPDGVMNPGKVYPGPPPSARRRAPRP